MQPNHGGSVRVLCLAALMALASNAGPIGFSGGCYPSLAIVQLDGGNAFFESAGTPLQ